MSNEQDVEIAQADETSGHLEEPESKALVGKAPEDVKKTKAVRRVPPKIYRGVSVQDVVAVPKSKAKAKARGRPKEYALTDKKVVPIDEEQGDSLNSEEKVTRKESLNVVDDGRDNKHDENIFNLSPDTKTHRIAHKRRQALGKKQHQITTLF